MTEISTRKVRKILWIRFGRPTRAASVIINPESVFLKLGTVRIIRWVKHTMIIGTMRKQKTFCTDKVRQGTLNSGTVRVTDRGDSRFEKNRTKVVAIRCVQCIDRCVVSCLASFHVGVITVKYFKFPACWSAYIYMIDKRSIIANCKCWKRRWMECIHSKKSKKKRRRIQCSSQSVIEQSNLPRAA